MATISAGGWGIFNAFAFAGAGYLFSKINKDGYEKELRRHNKAMEKLAKEKEKWYERDIARENRARELRRQMEDANADMNATNKAFNDYAKAMEERENDKEPVLEDYYQPSSEMQEYQHISTVVLGSVVGAATGFALKSLIF